MRDMHATRKGPGRRPQTVSSKTNAKEMVNFSGAKNMRKAADKRLTHQH